MDGIEAKVVECGVYNENGELVMKIDPESFDNDRVEEMIKTCFCSLNSGLPDKAITYLRECMEENTVGSTVFAEDGDLYLGYLNADNGIIGHTCIMPDIVNVSNPNDKTVFVEFADGTKEVAHLNDGDVFSLEVGVLICVVKKLLSEMDIIGTGSSAYNKIIKYALGKLDATKKKSKKQNNTYYYDNSGVMSIGWKTIEYGGENSKFYFDSNGKMATSWNVIDGHLYYFSPETGAMIKQLAGYTFDENGYLVASSGWHELGDGKYYSNSNDTYLTGWQKIGDDWYYFDEFGKIKTGWQLLTYNNDQYWYYFNETGVMQTGWQKIDNKWYYLFAGGSMAKGWQKIDDDWYYFKPYGTIVTDWQKIDYNCYYFNPGGSMVRDTCKTIESSNFCFNSFGVCTSGSGC